LYSLYKYALTLAACFGIIARRGLKNFETEMPKFYDKEMQVSMMNKIIDI